MSEKVEQTPASGPVPNPTDTEGINGYEYNPATDDWTFLRRALPGPIGDVPTVEIDIKRDMTQSTALPEHSDLDKGLDKPADSERQLMRYRPRDAPSHEEEFKETLRVRILQLGANLLATDPLSYDRFMADTKNEHASQNHEELLFKLMAHLNNCYTCDKDSVEGALSDLCYLAVLSDAKKWSSTQGRPF